MRPVDIVRKVLSPLHSKRSKWWLLLLLAVLLFIPTCVGEFWIHVATEMAIMSLFALSFNLLFGYTGRLSFGQAAYLGVAGYALILMYQHTHMNFVICSIIGVLMGGLWALMTGYLITRLSGIYHAIMTIVVAEATFYITFEWYSFTGGPNGLQITPPAILQDSLNYYLYTLAIVIPAIVAFWFLVNSPFGRSLKCIRDNPDKTPYIGIPMRKHLLIAFVIAGLYAALAGVLWAPFNRGISPWYCTMMKSGDAVFMAVLGGVYTFAGPILGAVIWTFLDVFISHLTEYWPLAIGCVMLLIVLFMRGGILGTVQNKLKGSRWGRTEKVLPTKEENR